MPAPIPLLDAPATRPLPRFERELPELESELLGLAGHLAAAQRRFLRVLAEFDERDGWAGPGMKSCAHWLSWRIGMSMRTAHEHVRVAHALRRLPRVDEAFAAGRLSYSKVRAITRICGRRPEPTDPPADPATERGAPDADPATTGPHAATDPAPHSSAPGSSTGDSSTGDGTTARPGPTVPATPATDPEQTLLDLALAGTAGHLESVVRAARRARTDPARQQARRSVRWRWDEDGSLVMSARLAPAEGAALIAALDADTGPTHAPGGHPVPPAPDGWRERAEEQYPGTAVDRAAARRADALVRLTTTGPAGGPAGDGPSVLRGHAQVIVRIDASSGDAAVPGGPDLPPSTAERLACDARVQVLLEDTARNRLHLGRARRLASPAQIAALTVRDDGRCRFAGCTHTRHLHAHHLRSWLRGGRTDVDNLVLVCSFHHALVHDRGYRIRRGPGGGWQTSRPDGTPVPAAGEPLTGNVESLIEMHTRAALRVTPGGLTPSWGGDRLDPTTILRRLLPEPPAAGPTDVAA